MADGAAAYVDATAGVAGDMLLGALLDAGADAGAVDAAVESLGVPGLAVTTRRERRGGFACTRLGVVAPPEQVRERRLADLLAHVDAATDLDPAARHLAAQVFTLLADAEAAVHGVTSDEVHFHEVGALDALAEVVGVAAAAASLGLLAPDAVVRCSPLAAGHGTVTSAHGRLPVPVPAVLRLAAGAGFALTGGDLAGERTTPTGAALVAALAVPGDLPDLRVDAVGVGGGRADPPDRPNLTRVVVGRRAGVGTPGHDEVLVVEATVDDLDPRLWPAVLGAVRAAGAWDCWAVPYLGRHGRPGHVLTAVCAPATRDAVVQAAFRHTTTLGVRWSRRERAVAARRPVPVEIGPPGARQTVTVKVADGPEPLPTASAELAEAERAAVALGWPLRAVCEAAVAAFRARE